MGLDKLFTIHEPEIRAFRNAQTIIPVTSQWGRYYNSSRDISDGMCWRIMGMYVLLESTKASQLSLKMRGFLVYLVVRTIE